ncbi:histidine phosphatase family protein [Cellulosilyticum sp. I15G10I2]|uniref:histidine phosphatase family protein n=1 Tax=Cellulosilyticum sp. I15G10I2 TaxID=1892843 RepID=UPI00085CBCED|nr:histidine phosphatase family protein [Cellulosilyticum sp. I15G10I2]
MKTTLLLIRHGETKWNTLGKFQGRQNIDLSERGALQAELLGKHLNGNFNAIYSSPLNRALSTAEILCKDLSFAPIPLGNLTEIHFGTWEGLTYKEIEQNYPEHFSAWRTDEKIAPMYDGELSIYNASLRAKACVLDIASKHPNEKVVIVSHGGLIKAALIGLFGWNMTMYHQIALGNTCINTIKFDEKLSPLLIGLNDTNHLTEHIPLSI